VAIIRSGGFVKQSPTFVGIMSAMPDAKGDEWRGRLAAAIAASGKTNREIAKEAGLSHGYLTSLLKEGKTPTLTSFMALAAVLGTSVGELAEGIKVSKETEQMWLLWEKLPKDRKALLLDLAEKLDRTPPER
jgi:transcriptional regulator with XRE-family HTH domain